MADTSIFNNPIEENGVKYYTIPLGYPVWKAHKTLSLGNTLILEPNRPYFFGLKDMNPAYIESYEEEYGVIFEFVTMREYRLIALDDKQTQTTLYQNAPANIKRILENNYGYHNNLRNSVSEPDRQISEYICSLGYDGYAIHDMKTDNMGGIFHDELMICDASDLEYVGKVTPDNRVQYIKERGRLEQMGKEMEEARKKGRPRSVFNNMESPIKAPRLDFDSDDEDDDAGFQIRGRMNFDEMGGSNKNKRTNKRKKSNKKRKTRAKRRKSGKSGKRKY